VSFMRWGLLGLMGNRWGVGVVREEVGGWGAGGGLCVAMIVGGGSMDIF